MVAIAIITFFPPDFAQNMLNKSSSTKPPQQIFDNSMNQYHIHIKFVNMYFDTAKKRHHSPKKKTRSSENFAAQGPRVIGLTLHMGVSKNSGTPKSRILIGFSIIFTIHFGVPLLLGNTHMGNRMGSQQPTLAARPGDFQ